ncbi:ABC transporter ATP-binding protein [Desulfosarcina sp. OttesenSCG-928-A07]|nr:ABC transporter ATP-binding protein [Desulfosarcina sp. OttesenSCG-928-A07]
MSCPALTINDLCVTFPAGNREILHHLSFSVPGGHTVALVGESGSGKTMAAMAVMNLLPHGMLRSGGSISVNDHPTEGLSPDQYRKLRHTQVAMVMQNPMSAFDPVLNIFHHFKETLISHGITSTPQIRKMAADGLAEAGFSTPFSILELYPFQMSGGMLQRVMLALALMLSPPLVIADEATTDLDVLSQKRILTLLHDHCRKQHLALLIITHDLGVAAAMADEIVVIRSGRLVEKGPTADIFSAPASPYTAELLAVHRGLYTPRYLNIMESLTGRGVYAAD